MLSSIKKIVFCLIISFSIALTIFFTTISSLPDYVYEEHEKFYLQELPNEKIFIFGSSQTFAINPIIVSDVLSAEGHNYTVFHLGQGSFDAEERLRTVDLISSQKPEIIIYGVAYQTFYSHGRNTIEKPIDSVFEFPTVRDFLAVFSLPINTGLIDNPKYATINTINHFFQTWEGKYDEVLPRPYPNTPFFIMDDNAKIPAEQKDLEVGGRLADFRGMEMYPIEKYRSFNALKKLIHNLHENEIEVIIFTVPHHKNWLTQLPEQQTEIFDGMMDNLEQEFDLKVYRLHDKYDTEGIWIDHDHIIAYDEKTNFYSEEIATILLTEMKEK